MGVALAWAILCLLFCIKYKDCKNLVWLRGILIREAVCAQQGSQPFCSFFSLL